MKSLRERFNKSVWNSRVAIARWIDGSSDLSQAPDADDPLVDVLHHALGIRTGKIRVSDAYLICGLEAGKVNQDQIVRFGRAIRALGWARGRRRRNGVLEYVYVKGDAKEREVALSVEYDPHMRSVRIEIDTNHQTSAN